VSKYSNRFSLVGWGLKQLGCQHENGRIDVPWASDFSLHSWFISGQNRLTEFFDNLNDPAMQRQVLSQGLYCPPPAAVSAGGSAFKSHLYRPSASRRFVAHLLSSGWRVAAK